MATSYTPSVPSRTGRLPSRRATAAGAVIVVAGVAGAIGILRNTGSSPVSAGPGFTAAAAAQVAGHSLSEEAGRVNTVATVERPAPARLRVALPSSPAATGLGGPIAAAGTAGG